MPDWRIITQTLVQLTWVTWWNECICKILYTQLLIYHFCLFNVYCCQHILICVTFWWYHVLTRKKCFEDWNKKFNRSCLSKPADTSIYHTLSSKNKKKWSLNIFLRIEWRRVFTITSSFSQLLMHNRQKKM
jgi:hypothetical protein